MNSEELEQFRTFFSKYCRQEINAGKCHEGDCEFCSVNNAYERIFSETDSENND